MLCGRAGRLKGVARQPEEGLQPVRSLSRAFGVLVLPFACALLVTTLPYSVGVAQAATLYQPEAPLQGLTLGRAVPVDSGLRGSSASDVRDDAVPGRTAVIVGVRARRIVAEAAMAQAILTARPAPVVPCADPGGAGITLVAERAGGGLEIIHVVLRSLKGPSFDLADLP